MEDRNLQNFTQQRTIEPWGGMRYLCHHVCICNVQRILFQGADIEADKYDDYIELNHFAQ